MKRKRNKKCIAKFIPAGNRNNKIPLNISLKKNLEMNSRSRESSLKRENQNQKEEQNLENLQSEATEIFENANDQKEPQLAPKANSKKKKLLINPSKKENRNDWRNIFYNHAKIRKDNSSEGHSINRSEHSDSISIINQNKGNESARSKVPLLKKNFGRELDTSKNSMQR